MYILNRAKILKHLRHNGYAERFDSKSTSIYLDIDHSTVCKALRHFEKKGVLKVESISEGEAPYKQVLNGTMLSEGMKRLSVIDRVLEYLTGMNLIAEIIRFLIIFFLTFWLTKSCQP